MSTACKRSTAGWTAPDGASTAIGRSQARKALSSLTRREQQRRECRGAADPSGCSLLRCSRERYSHQYRRPRGVFLSVNPPENVEESLRNYGLHGEDVDLNPRPSTVRRDRGPADLRRQHHRDRHDLLPASPRPSPTGHSSTSNSPTTEPTSWHPYSRKCCGQTAVGTQTIDPKLNTSWSSQAKRSDTAKVTVPRCKRPNITAAASASQTISSTGKMSTHGQPLELPSHAGPHPPIRNRQHRQHRPSRPRKQQDPGATYRCPLGPSRVDNANQSGDDPRLTRRRPFAG
jgi:hypothetical protein